MLKNLKPDPRMAVVKGLRLKISGVIQGVKAVREDLLVLVRRGHDDRVVSEGLRKISRADRASN